MKDKSYIWISFIILIFGIWSVPKIMDKFKKSDLMVIGKAPAFELINQNGSAVSSDDFKGKVYVVEFFFANCPTICPIMNQNMLKLQDTFYGNLNFGIASITIDPIRDTPDNLKTYSSNLGVKLPYWYMLTGDMKYIHNLAAKYNMFTGVNNDAPGGFEHSGLFALVDQEGNIRCRIDEHGNPILYYDGTTDQGIEWITEDIKSLLNE